MTINKKSIWILVAAMLTVTSPTFAQSATAPAADGTPEAEIARLREQLARAEAERAQLQHEADEMARAGIGHPSAPAPAPAAPPTAAPSPTPAPAKDAAADGSAGPPVMSPPPPTVAPVALCNPTGPFVSPLRGLNETMVFSGFKPPQFAGSTDTWIKIMTNGKSFFSFVVNGRFAETFVGLAPANRSVARGGNGGLCQGLSTVGPGNSVSYVALDHAGPSTVTVYCWQKTGTGALEMKGHRDFTVNPDGSFNAVISMADELCRP